MHERVNSDRIHDDSVEKFHIIKKIPHRIILSLKKEIGGH